MRHGMKHPYPTDHPVTTRGRRSSTMRWGLAIVASSSMIFGMASVSGAAPPAKQTVPVQFVDPAEPDPAGSATLTRTNSGVSMRISTTVGGLMWDLPFAPPVDPESPDVGASWEVGDATTNWFVVFNNPELCTPEPAPQCGEDDVRAGIADFMDGLPYNGGPAGASVHFAAGHVAGSSTWRAAGSLREGDTSRWLFPSVPLDDAMTAEVHIIVHSHGQMTDIMPGDRGEALNTVFGGCAPLNGTNICGDPQAAIFKAPA